MRQFQLHPLGLISLLAIMTGTIASMRPEVVARIELQTPIYSNLPLDDREVVGRLNDEGQRFLSWTHTQLASCWITPDQNGTIRELRQYICWHASDQQMAAITELDGLRKMTLFGFSMTDLTLDHIARSTSLREVEIYYSDFSEDSVERFTTLRPDIILRLPDQSM